MINTYAGHVLSIGRDNNIMGVGLNASGSVVHKTDNGNVSNTHMSSTTAVIDAILSHFIYIFKYSGQKN